MSYKLIAKTGNPPVGALMLTGLMREEKKTNIEINWSGDLKNCSNVQLMTKDGSTVIGNSENEIARFFARNVHQALYGGNDPLERTEVDSWLTFAIGHVTATKISETTLDYLNSALALKTWLVANHLTIADIRVFSALYYKQDVVSENKYPNIVRWIKHMEAQPSFAKIAGLVGRESNNKEYVHDQSKEKRVNKKDSVKRKQEGNFIDLPGAEMGKMVVRFPPEASGYLHIGHAKAALLNQYYAEAFKGKLIMRFDDTNPAKENVEFEKAILEDLEMLQIKPDVFSHSSDHFDLMLKYCEKLIKDGKAYVDDTPAEAMKEQREQKLPSTNRDRSVEDNLKMWEEMKKGTAKGQQCCVRAKIDYQSANGCMRDPTIYRCKCEPHPKTGTRYKVYPTYDFACPIVDAIEGVTHTLRTTEYHDRDPQFYWFIEALGLNRPYIWAYSRLNMTHTVLSKRKLTWFVSEGLVDGWDDPRFPTVRGILRRGMTVAGLKEFIIAQGSSKSVVFMEWDKIWAFNKKVIDPVAVRYTAIGVDKVPVTVANAKAEWLTVQNHPKDKALGMKQVLVGPNVEIERDDANILKVNENATFINWGNLLIKKIERKDDKIVSVSAVTNLDDKNFKNTPKISWVCSPQQVNEKDRQLIPCVMTYFDHIISKAVLAKDDDFKDFVAKNTRREEIMLGECELSRVKKGEIIQILRKGFFRCDVPFAPTSSFSGREQPLILFHIPDGHSNTPTSSASEEKSTTKAPYITKSAPDSKAVEVHEKIVSQGNKIRDLKSKKADKTTIEPEVKTLLALKVEYKTITGSDWTPSTNLKSVAAPALPSADPSKLCEKIAEQGNKVRELKSKKADKASVESEVKCLLALKAEYKNLTGADWKPEVEPVAKKAAVEPQSGDSSKLSQQIVEQGNKVRELKSKKADKASVETEVKCLLALKAEFKSLTGSEWKPEVEPVAKKAAVEPQSGDSSKLSQQIVEQGNKVRELKSKKADKASVETEVKTLLALKAEFKSLTGSEWKPSASDNSAKMSTVGSPVVAEQNNKIVEQGNKIRKLKSEKANKTTIEAEVKVLLALKAEYKSLTGSDWTPAGTSVSVTNSSDKEKGSENKAAKIGKAGKKVQAECEKRELDINTKTGTRLGLEVKKNENLADWYSQVITKGEMIEYYDVSGCYVLRPWSFSIWESIKDFFDKEIKKLGVQNCYFPIFVSRSALEREKEHIADFAPEVAWVTKSGDSDLAEHIAIRPTSETVMYPAYAKWIKSHRDLPLKLNQWNNVVRWEFKHPQPFLRTREFLWQEGHTAFATKAEADEEVLQILDLYRRIYEEYLAIPVVPGRKSEKEKFAGGDYTTTVEAFVSASGRGIQGATSHHLGQNFSKMFDIQIDSAADDTNRDKSYVYQNSWGLTTRTIGVMIMVHGDDKGLVLPPKVAALQVIIVPCGITASTSQQQRDTLMMECAKLENELKADQELRVKGDYRDNYSPGWKFNHWELKGVPVRLELGPKDLAKNQITLVRRDNGERLTTARKDASSAINNLLVQIQNNLFNKAKTDLDEHIKITNNWENFCDQLENKNLLLAPFCGDTNCEDNIKRDSARKDATDPTAPSMGAKSLCVPFKQPQNAQKVETLKCIHTECNRKPQNYVLFGRSY